MPSLTNINFGFNDIQDKNEVKNATTRPYTR